MKKAELVLIPIPARGHIVSAVEIAKLLVQRDDRLSTTIFIYPSRNPVTTKDNESLAASTLPDRLRVIILPSAESSDTKPPNQFITSVYEGQKPLVREYVSKIKTQSELSPDSPQFAGFIFDAYATGLKDLANEFDVPWSLSVPQTLLILVACYILRIFMMSREWTSLSSETRMLSWKFRAWRTHFLLNACLYRHS
jgi:hypothetical protein